MPCVSERFTAEQPSDSSATPWREKRLVALIAHCSVGSRYMAFCHLGGMPECSRWLSAATPPDFVQHYPDPGGVAGSTATPPASVVHDFNRARFMRGRKFDCDPSRVGGARFPSCKFHEGSQIRPRPLRRRWCTISIVQDRTPGLGRPGANICDPYRGRNSVNDGLHCLRNARKQKKTKPKGSFRPGLHYWDWTENCTASQ
jgi:hypothetical protein